MNEEGTRRSRSSIEKDTRKDERQVDKERKDIEV